jgi:Na+-translocating ferredoxin:NAD+ oxidoreductase RnfE subunit
MEKSKNLYNKGYIYAPYIIVNEPCIIVGNSKEFIRRQEIKKRNEKINKLIENTNEIIK